MTEDLNKLSTSRSMFASNEGNRVRSHVRSLRGGHDAAIARLEECWQQKIGPRHSPFESWKGPLPTYRIPRSNPFCLMDHKTMSTDFPTRVVAKDSISDG